MPQHPCREEDKSSAKATPSAVDRSTWKRRRRWWYLSFPLPKVRGHIVKHASPSTVQNVHNDGIVRQDVRPLNERWRREYAPLSMCPFRGQAGHTPPREMRSSRVPPRDCPLPSPPSRTFVPALPPFRNSRTYVHRLKALSHGRINYSNDNNDYGDGHRRQKKWTTTITDNGRQRGATGSKTDNNNTQ